MTTNTYRIDRHEKADLLWEINSDINPDETFEKIWQHCMDDYDTDDAKELLYTWCEHNLMNTPYGGDECCFKLPNGYFICPVWDQEALDAGYEDGVDIVGYKLANPYQTIVEVDRYSYADLIAAVRVNESEANLQALLDWFYLYGNQYWNGECFDSDDGFRLFPVYEYDEETDTSEVIGAELRWY